MPDPAVLPAVLFVCLGNICRSPLAQAAFDQAASRQGIDITSDSAGTGDWHIGRPPDQRAQDEAMRNGIDISSYRARQVTARDFTDFTHILALDHTNLSDLKQLRPPGAMARLSLLLDHVPGMSGKEVADPYFGYAAGFAQTWQEVASAAEALARKLAAK